MTEFVIKWFDWHHIHAFWSRLGDLLCPCHPSCQVIPVLMCFIGVVAEYVFLSR